MMRIPILALTWSCLLLQPTQAIAQAINRPAVHWGTFTKTASLNDCLRYAEDAMREYSYEIWERGGYVRIGSNNAAVVQVVCVPTGQGSDLAVTVSAFSSDSKTAELARNNIRAKIVRWHRIDPDS